MPVSLSVKNVPDELAARLRARADRNRRSLQRELLSILESVSDDRNALPASPTQIAPGMQSIEDVARRARELFPRGSASSVRFIRALRDGR